MPRILIVEDEPDIALGLREDLARNGYEVEVVGDGDAALARADGERWDLILLDVMLPRLDGYEVCRELRRRRDRTPIILLTAKVQEAEKVLGLELGADDYVTKPFSPRELRARIKAVLRRFDDGAAGVERFGDIEVDFDRAEVRRGGEPVIVTALELRLLKAFLERRGRVLSRSQLIDVAWEPGTNVTDRVVDTHILHLRQKVEPVPAEPRYIKGVRGIGYRFDG
jgi:DNA-binding response OmpR family regulator